MDTIINQLLAVGEGLMLLGTTWFIWFLSGVANNLFSTAKWSWKRTGEDLLKTFLMVVATLAWVVVINLLDGYTSSLGFDISKLLDGASVVGLIGIIVGGASVYTYKGYRNIIKFFVKSHTVREKIEAELGLPAEITEEQYAEVAEPAKQVVKGIYQFFTQPKESVEAHKEWEDKGGRGAAYVVNIKSYDTFRKDVYGKSINVDGVWGPQCWDLCCALWQQLGTWLQTGNGCAYGCWTLKRDQNKGKDFILITDKNQIKRGDVLVFRCGEFGHIGFADEDYKGNNVIKLLGQNQGGTPHPQGGSSCNVVNMNMTSFLGAFRYKGWETTVQPEPTPAPAPAKEEPKAIFSEGERVKVTKRVDINGVKLANLQSDYEIIQVGPQDVPRLADSVVLKTDDGNVYARVPLANIKKVS